MDVNCLSVFSSLDAKFQLPDLKRVDADLVGGVRPARIPGAVTPMAAPGARMSQGVAVSSLASRYDNFTLLQWYIIPDQFTTASW